jgi:hypothetical protein
LLGLNTQGLIDPAAFIHVGCRFTENQCDADFDSKLMTATPTTMRAMPMIAGASKL